MVFIWSFEHKAWWKQDCRGYTKDIDHAGEFKLTDGVHICNAANIKTINFAIVPKVSTWEQKGLPLSLGDRDKWLKST